MTQYTLRLTFDLRQVTQTLGYEFVLANTEYAREQSGPLAGTFNFQEKDDINIEVVATSAAHPNPKNGITDKDILTGITVTNCTFVSIPAHMTEKLSLFDHSKACATIEDWNSAQPPGGQVDDKNNTLKLTSKSASSLTVNTQNGQWKISGYLSVMLSTKDGEQHPQLYFFDPEGSSGNGGGWD